MTRLVNVFATVILIASAGAISMQQQSQMAQQDQQEPVCASIVDPAECAGYYTGECFWDNSDQRCESRYNLEDPCSRIASIPECVSKSECFWDSNDQRCESRN